MEAQSLAVQIVRYVDDSQPGWVACEFEDAEGRRHTLIEKVSVLTCEDLRPDSTYPSPGSLQCESLARWRDPCGRELVRISTMNPLGRESTEGLSEFVVEASKLSEIKAPIRRDWSVSSL